MKLNNADILDLDRMTGYKLSEQFNAALAEVMANVQDMGTDAKARKLNIAFTIEPTPKDRQTMVIGVAVTTKLRPQEGIGKIFRLVRGSLMPADEEHLIPGQMDAWGEEHGTSLEVETDEA